MAETEAVTADVTELTNKGARADRINDAFDQIYQLDDDIALMEERHLKQVKQARTKAWRNLKADVNIPRKQLEPHYKLYKIARQAWEGDEADEVLDNMREAHEALHAGQTVDWVAVMEGTQGQGQGQGPAAAAE